MKHKISSVIVVLFFLIMLIRPRQVFQGAEEGLLLWYRTILPTLLPFSIAANLMIETDSIHYITRIFRPFLCSIFKVSPAGSFAIVVGFLCGYPLGAKSAAQLVSTGYISEAEGSYLLSFCNNVSPVFIINYVVLASMKKPELLIPVVGILISAPVISSFLFRFYSFCRYKAMCAVRDTTHIEDGQSAANSISSCTIENQTEINAADSMHQNLNFNLHLFNKCMMDSFEMLVYVGGYLMMFSVIFTLLKDMFSQSSLSFFTYLLPMLEITNGISYIQQFGLPFNFCFILTLMTASFGGICQIAQTHYVLEGTTLSIRKYTIEKLVTMLVTSLIAILYLQVI